MNVVQSCVRKNYIYQHRCACASSRNVSASVRSSKALNSSVISSAQWATETYTHFRGTSGCFTLVEDISLRENLRAPCDNGGLFTELSRRAEGKTGARGLPLSTILHTYNVATSWVRTLFMLTDIYCEIMYAHSEVRLMYKVVRWDARAETLAPCADDRNDHMRWQKTNMFYLFLFYVMFCHMVYVYIKWISVWKCMHSYILYKKNLISRLTLGYWCTFRTWPCFC